MRRALVPALLLLTLILTACGTKPAPTGSDTNVSTPPASTDTPANPPGDSSSQPPQETPPPPPPEQPAIKWYAPSIGMPLKSDDPAAQGKKVIALTFDDGPSNTGTTARILDILAEQNVKATFFITGYGAKNMDLVERIYKEGHALGPHTMTHPNLAELSPAEQREEIEPLVKLIEGVTGKAPHYLRPPFGSYDDNLEALMKDMNMEIMNWSLGSLDWDGTKDGYKDPNLVVKDVLDNAHPGAVVLMHDTLRHTAEALPEILKGLKAEGYEFVTLN